MGCGGGVREDGEEGGVLNVEAEGVAEREFGVVKGQNTVVYAKADNPAGGLRPEDFLSVFFEKVRRCEAERFRIPVQLSLLPEPGL